MDRRGLFCHQLSFQRLVAVPARSPASRPYPFLPEILGEPNKRDEKLAQANLQRPRSVRPGVMAPASLNPINFQAQTSGQFVVRFARAEGPVLFLLQSFARCGSVPRVMDNLAYG